MKNLLSIIATNRGKGNGYTSSTFGELSDVNMWNRSFTLDEIRDWTECKMNDAGNIIDRVNAEFDSLGFREVFEERAKICDRTSEGEIQLLLINTTFFSKRVWTEYLKT